MQFSEIRGEGIFRCWVSNIRTKEIREREKREGRERGGKGEKKERAERTKKGVQKVKGNYYVHGQFSARDNQTLANFL